MMTRQVSITALCGQRLFLTVVFTLVLLTSAVSQPHYKIIDYKKLNESVTMVNRIVRDNQGMMWFATDDGLYRYDGYDFVNFKSRSGNGVNMPSNRIHSMYESSEGGIWCIISDRVFLFDTHTCSFVDVMESYEKTHGESYHIRKIRPLPCGTTWIFTDDNKVFALEDAQPIRSLRLLIENERSDNITVVCDSLQRSWVLTTDKTFLYQRGVIKPFNQPFRHIVLAKNNIWFLNKEGKPYRYDEQRKTIVAWSHPLLKSAVGSLSTLSNGSLVMSSRSQLLLVSADGKQVTKTNVTWPIQKVMEDADRHMWILADDGSLSIADKSFMDVRKVNGIPHSDKCDIMRDQHGTVWIFTGRGDTYYALPTDLTNPVRYTDCEMKVSISNTIEDGQHGYWFIHQNHAYRLTFESPHYQHLPLHQNDQVRCVFRDGKQHIMVSSRYDESIAVFSASGQRLGWLGRDGMIHSSWTSFGAAVYSSYMAADGTLWLGTKKNGLYRLRPRANGGYQISNYRKEDGAHSIPDNEIYAITADHKNRLWIGTHKGGLCCIPDMKAENPAFIYADNGLSGWKAFKSASVRTLLVTPTNQLLVGTYSGLFVADIHERNLSKITFKEHLREPNRKESLSSSSITDIIMTSDKRIFLSTCDGGVNELLSGNIMDDQLAFRHYNRTTGFPTDITHALLEYKGSLWTVAPNQLIEIQLKKSQSPGITSFLLRESPRFSVCQPTQAGNGNWFFGSEEGALLIDLDELKKNTFVPTLVITGVTKNNHIVEYDAYQNDMIIMNPHERDLTIHFAALDYENTELVAYAYRMENSKTWTYIGHNHSVTLAQMRPGTYRMHIRSTNSDGIWCDNEHVVTIIVKPTFWETPWAILLILSIIAAIVGTITYTWLYIRRIKRQQHETMEAYLSLLEKKNEKQDEQVPAIAHDNQQALSSENDELMKKLMSYIEENIAVSDIVIEDMAAAVGLSRTGLYRKVKNLVGTSPMEFLREARIRKAMQMLDNPSVNVSEVAYACGFSDPKYFSKCFKAATGQTPTEYKKTQSVSAQ